MARVAVLGCGATGTRVARQLIRAGGSHELMLAGRERGAASQVASSLAPGVASSTVDRLDDSHDIWVLAVEAGQHARLAERALVAGSHAVSVSDSLADIDGLLALHESAAAAGRTVVVGAGMMPGLSDVLARHGASWFDQVDEIHVMKFGTGGPACARQHHRALKGVCLDWRGEWVRRPGGSGRELAWFPAPVPAADCYRANLGDPRLLVRAHPGVGRVTARMAATRRDRLTMHLPMLRRPHPEGLLGAVRVELRGTYDGRTNEVVLGCSERPAVAAGAVAAAAVDHLSTHSEAPGSFGLAEVVAPTPFLHGLRARGLRPEIFVGAEESY